MAAEIKRRTGNETRLIEGGGGIFDVAVDGEVIYSRDETGRFPEHDEIVNAIEAAAS